MALRNLIERGKLTKLLAVLAGLAIITALGVIDYYTGHELMLSSFYTMPIALVAWVGGRPLGLCASLLSGATWLITDVIDGLNASPSIVALNAVIRFGFFILIVYMIVALRDVMKRLEQSSQFDNLTGVANSSSFYESLTEELDRLGRYGRPLTLAYLDLDGFKEVNDGFGHLEGDRVLRVVADCAKARLRKTDTVARMGGDEFAFLCPETDEEAARAAIQKVVDGLGEEMREGGWPVTFSVGVVTCHEAPAGAEELVRMADDLMYSVKLDTKNGLKFASTGCAHTDRPACDEQTLLDARRSWLASGDGDASAPLTAIGRVTAPV
jgi:diguanylate cyclase (GGDEF)-like protein